MSEQCVGDFIKIMPRKTFGIRSMCGWFLVCWLSRVCLV